MLVGVPKEIKDNEFRVGLTPSSVSFCPFCWYGRVAVWACTSRFSTIRWVTRPMSTNARCLRPTLTQ